MVGTFPLMNALGSAVPFTPHGRNEATQTQMATTIWHTSQGKDNESIIDQNSNGYAASVTDRNVANHYQYGNGNYAKTTQLGFEILITFARRKSKHVGYYANWIYFRKY
jgi:hypothetical protein